MLRRIAHGFFLLPLLLGCLQPALTHAADASRGGRLYATSPAPGQLACIDCHSDNPQVNNFGNIFSGRNAVGLIERAISLNTGGMGVFNRYYTAADLADIAAYLGNSPAVTDFGRVPVGTGSVLRTVTISSSTKQGLERLSLSVEGDFARAGGDCGAALARFSSCTVDLVFRPTATGARAGALVIDHGGTPTPVRLALVGEGEAAPRAIARVAPQALDFGAVRLGGAPRARAVVVANDSPDPLTLQRLNLEPADYVWAGGSCRMGAVLPSGQRCTLSFHFTPQQAGVRAGQAVLVHNGVGGESRVALTGRGDSAGPHLAVMPAWLDFGVTALDGLPAGQQTVTVHNLGAQPWPVPAARLTDAQFTLVSDGCSGAPLASGAHCQLVVGFEPRREGPAQAELLIEGDSRIALAGRALASSSAWLTAEPARPWFETSVGQGVSQRISLANRGSQPVVLQLPTLSGGDASDFSLASDGDCAAGLTLPAGASCGVTIRFAPGPGAAQRSARLRLEAAGAAAPALLVDLRGQVRAQPGAQLWLDASSLAFAARTPGADVVAQALPLTLNNRGAAPLVWRHLAVSGARAADFKLAAGDCAGGLGAGAGCQLQVSFEPAADGAAGEDRLASLVLQPDDASPPVVVPLRGHRAATLVVHPRPELARVDFGRQPLSGTPGPTRLLRIWHESAAPAPAWSISVDGPFQVAALSPACARGAAVAEPCAVELRFVPQAAGPAVGRLSLQGPGTGARATVALAGEAVQTAPMLTWQGLPAWPSHALTAVGSISRSATLLLTNRGTATSQPLLWQVSGAAAAEFSLDPAPSGCAAGQRLAVGESCAVRVAFHPRAAGDREAVLSVGEAGAPPSLVWPLRGRGLAPPVSVVQLLPSALAFVAEGGVVPPARVFRLRNDGTAALALASVRLQGAGFTLAAGEPVSCDEASLVLLPGESCALSLAWAGRADGASGNALLLGADDPLGETSVPLGVSESPSLRSNEGGSGGGGLSAVLLVWLMAAAWLLPGAPRSMPRR